MVVMLASFSGAAMVKETFFIPKIPLTVSSIIFMLPRTSGVPSDSERGASIYLRISRMPLSSRSVPAQVAFTAGLIYRQGVDLGVEQIHAAVNIAYRRAQFVRHQQVDLAHVLVSRHFIGDIADAHQPLVL